MSDEQTPAPGPNATPEGAGGGNGTAAAQQPPLIINVQYIKDLSFEAPSTPAVFGMLQQKQPEISLSVNVSAQPVQGNSNTFEVVLSTRAECKLGETVCFMLELEYAGVFTLNVEDQYRQAVLLIECPRLLFPYARHLMSTVTRDGGFPPLMIGPIDFAQMYQQRLREFSAQQQAKPTTA